MPASKQYLLDEALRMYSSGASSAEVAGALDLGETTVLRWVKRSGLGRTAAESKGITKVIIDSAIEMYESGLSIQAVADALGIGTSTIHRALKAAGKSRSLKDLQTPGSVKHAAIGMYLSGMTTYEVADAIGCQQATVSGWTREFSVSRGYSGAQALRVAKDRHHTGYGKKCWFDSRKAGGEVYCASTYELARLIEFESDDEVVSIKRCSDVISYGHRRYTPDFVVKCLDGTTFVEEVKPYNMTSRPDVMAKAEAAEAHYRATGSVYRIITEAHMADWALDLVTECGARFKDVNGVRQSINSARWSRKVLSTERAGA